MLNYHLHCSHYLDMKFNMIELATNPSTLEKPLIQERITRVPGLGRTFSSVIHDTVRTKSHGDYDSYVASIIRESTGGIDLNTSFYGVSCNQLKTYLESIHTKLRWQLTHVGFNETQLSEPQTTDINLFIKNTLTEITNLGVKNYFIK
jgi:hypothetical protein